MDSDLDGMDRAALIAEVKRLRAGIRTHRDSTGHELCWHHPALWGLLPEPVRPEVAVPPWPQFLRGCVAYRASLDRERPDAPADESEYQDAAGADAGTGAAAGSFESPSTEGVSAMTQKQDQSQGHLKKPDQKAVDGEVDEALEETFPASDPPAYDAGEPGEPEEGARKPAGADTIPPDQHGKPEPNPEDPKKQE